MDTKCFCHMNGFAVKDADARKRLEYLETYATPKMYGAVADGAADDTQAIRDCIKDHGVVRIPKGSYKITQTIEVGTDKQIVFDKGAKIFVHANVDAFSITGNRVKIENLHIDTTTTPDYSSCALLFGESYNEDIVITDAYIRGVQNVTCNTDPYVPFAEQEYPNGIGIRVYKPTKYACNVRIVRPTVIGFSCALQVYVGAKTSSDSAPWVTELSVTDFVFKNMGHAIEVSNKLVEECTFTGYVQCHLQQGDQQYISIYGGKRCYYQVSYWDRNGKWFITPAYSANIIDRQANDRMRCDDFGKTIWLNGRTCRKGSIYSKGICSHDNNHQITENDYSGEYMIRMLENGKSGYFLFKDGFGNYLLPVEEGGEKKVEFTISAISNCKVFGHITAVQDAYYNHNTGLYYKPAYEIFNAAGNTITLDNVENLAAGDELCIWGLKDPEYGYLALPNDSHLFKKGESKFKIVSVDTENNTVTVDSEITNSGYLTGKSVSKMFFGSYKLFGSGQTVTMAPKDVSLSFVLPDFSELVNVDYITLGISIVPTDGAVGDVVLSNVRITI